LDKIEYINRNDIPTMVSDFALEKNKKYPSWSPKYCTHFCTQILQFLKNNVVKENVVYELKRDEKPRDSDLVLEEAPDHESFLPEWYLDD
jgi:hypothetical protein